MKLQWQIIFGLMLVFAVLASLAVAQPLEEDELDDSGSDESVASDPAAAEDVNVQQDYLNVADYTKAPSPWWWN
ncbi:uncharacterized protein LOC111069046 [Drosophila obscura]|uniref:uncharacterized protein LOC111069046 n=1 Tax=Drosophila obscura TaxID=7282 RepID=UPI001BB131B5|nr:uncharacterized protein LOC111069046 [Drosophila obscura]